MTDLATPALDEIEIPTEPRVRRSLKYRITPAHTRLLQDVVFADNPDEAIAKGRERYGIPEGENVTIVRLTEPDNVEMRIN